MKILKVHCAVKLQPQRIKTVEHRLYKWWPMWFVSKSFQNVPFIRLNSHILSKKDNLCYEVASLEIYLEYYLCRHSSIYLDY